MLKKTIVSLTAAVFLGTGILAASLAFAGNKCPLDQMIEKDNAACKAKTENTVAKAESAGNTVCPVMGGKVDDKSTSTYEYKGKVYRFCCSSCVEDFKKDPEKYISKMKKTK